MTDVTDEVDATRPDARSKILGWWPVAAAFAAIVAIESAVYAFIKARGVSVTGDEPHYLIVGKALAHFTVYPLQAYKADLQSHQIFNWPPGSAATNLNLQLYAGPHGPVSTHSLGLSALLAPFVETGGARFARVGLMAIEAVGFIYFFLRASDLAGLHRRGRVVFAVLLASPAIWLAGTQIYPDLLTGILLACLLVDVLRIESGRRIDNLGVAVCSLSLALLPWLHQQNLVPAVFVLVALAVVTRKARLWPSYVIVAAVSVVSWALLLAYNLYGYGHPLGLPQPFPSLNGAGVTEILGLMFDRHQGLFVQVPVAVLGLVGIWLARRVAPIAAVATLAAAASLIYLNGTFIHAPYGGTSFAGRFQWASIVPLLAWCPFVVASYSWSRARLWGLGVVAALLWLVESVPILRGHHVYYNQLAASTPWDPATYPGWWGLDRVLPQFVPGSHQFGWPWFGLPFELVLLVLAVLAAAGVASFRRRALVSLAVASAVVVAATAIVAAAARFPLPTRPLSFSDQDLGGPVQAAAAPASSPAVPLQGVGPGTFRITMAYTLVGASGSGTVISYCTRGLGDQAPQSGQSASSELAPGNHDAELTVHCAAGYLWFQMTATPPATQLAVDNFQVAKTASG